MSVAISSILGDYNFFDYDQGWQSAKEIGGFLFGFCGFGFRIPSPFPDFFTDSNFFSQVECFFVLGRYSYNVNRKPEINFLLVDQGSIPKTPKKVNKNDNIHK